VHGWKYESFYYDKSVRHVEALSHRLEFLEKNSIADSLGCSPSATNGTPRNFGRMQLRYEKRGFQRTKFLINISETGQDRTKVTIEGSHIRAFDW